MVFETEGLSSQSNLVRGTNPTDQEPEPVNEVLESEPDRKCCQVIFNIVKIASVLFSVVE